ncbi:MAG TPA: 5-oxoprolinase subunit PxpA [Chthoniobacterales bacterium]|nr:5-oxoprolinase subunit PxpA [Chthoniobacterales bacterium]
MSLAIDINADLGEGAGHDEQLLQLVTSANIACGLHAGDAHTMRATLLAAKERGVAVGAHPSFDDRENFGRREMSVSWDDLVALVAYQLGAFAAVAKSLGMRPQHVKPHGALYNMAARDEQIAHAFVEAVRRIDPTLVVFAPPTSELSRAAEASELQVAREVFADRNYMPDGSLVPRDHSQAMLHDPEEAADRVFRMLRDDKVQAIDGRDVDVHADTVCVHGDTPHAVEFALALRTALAQTGIVIGAPSISS